MMSKILMQLAIVLGVPMRKICQGKAKQSYSYTIFSPSAFCLPRGIPRKKHADFNRILFSVFVFFAMFSFLFGTNQQWEMVNTTVVMKQDSENLSLAEFLCLFLLESCPTMNCNGRKNCITLCSLCFFNTQTNQHFIVFGTSYYRASSSRTCSCTSFLQKEKWTWQENNMHNRLNSAFFSVCNDDFFDTSNTNESPLNLIALIPIDSFYFWLIFQTHFIRTVWDFSWATFFFPKWICILSLDIEMSAHLK